MKKQTLSLFCTLLMVAGAIAVRADYLVLKDGRKVAGDKVTVRINGDAIIYRGADKQTFARGSWVEAVGDKPKEFDQARYLASQGKHAEAIAVFEKVAKENFGLKWDVRSIAFKAQSQLDMGQPADSVKTLESLFRKNPEMRNGVPLKTYFDSLVAVKEFKKLEVMLAKAIKEGEAADKALAHVVMGDMKKSQGDPDAALIQYLMSALMFPEEVENTAEAAYKAGLVLKGMRDNRAEDMFKRAVDANPKSQWGIKAKQQI